MFRELDDFLVPIDKQDDVLNEELFREVFIFVKNNNEFCQVMLSDRGEIAFTKKLIKFLHSKFTNHFGDTNAAEHYFSFMVFGVLGIIESWLNNGMKETPEEMAEICSNIIQNKIREQLN